MSDPIKAPGTQGDEDDTEAQDAQAAPDAPASVPAPAASPQAPQAAPAPSAVTVDLLTDEAGFASKVIDVVAFDIVDAAATQGDAQLTWKPSGAEKTELRLEAEAAPNSTVTVTLTLKQGARR